MGTFQQAKNLEREDTLPRPRARVSGSRPVMKGGGQKRLALASRSPRRREMVEAFVEPIEMVASEGDEGPPRDGETPEALVLRLSRAKVVEAASQVPRTVVLGADTVVVLDGEVLRKPASAAEARRMLASLRGRTHRVVTGVVALDSESGRTVMSTHSTDVTLRRYSDDEVDAYVGSGEPLDKAGSYAVQDASFHPAESVEGCYLNVVGLPLCDVVTLLAQMGVDANLKPDWQPPEQCLDCSLRRDGEVSLP